LTTVPKTYFGKKTAFSINAAGKTGTPQRRLKVDPYFSPCTKTKFKMIKHPKARPETTRGKHFQHIGTGNDYLIRTTIALKLKEIIYIWDSIKRLLYNKGSNQQSKETPAEWQKIFASYSSDRGLISRICK
jgi:hypothetical protein